VGILLADDALAGAAIEIARGSSRPEEATLFLMDEGVRAAGDPRLRALLDDGAEVSLCAMDAEARGIAADDRGPRFGSQYDHAVLVRDARRVVSLTGAGAPVEDHTPAGEGTRRVLVRLTRDARHPKIAQALRAAAGYAAVDLSVTVLVEPDASALLSHGDHPPQVLRAIATLRGLGHTITAGQAPPADVVITW
jgi:hypothetical protein